MKKNIIDIEASEDWIKEAENLRQEKIETVFKKYNPEQPRDARGRWTSGSFRFSTSNRDYISALTNPRVDRSQILPRAQLAMQVLKEMEIDKIADSLGVELVIPTDFDSAMEGNFCGSGPDGEIVVQLSPFALALGSFISSENGGAPAMIEDIKNVAREEFIHAAWNVGLRNRWIAEAGKGRTPQRFNIFVKNKSLEAISAIGDMMFGDSHNDDVKESAQAAFVTSVNLYYKKDIDVKDAKPLFDQLTASSDKLLIGWYGEFVRQIYQSKRYGTLSETSAFGKLAGWLRDAYMAISSAWNYVVGGVFGSEIKRQIDDTANLLSSIKPALKTFAHALLDSKVLEALPDSAKALNHWQDQPRDDQGRWITEGGLLRAIANQNILSRTFGGKLDTSAAIDKVGYIKPVDNVEESAKHGFIRAYTFAKSQVDTSFNSAEELVGFFDAIARRASEHQVTELYREFDSNKFNYAPADKIHEEMKTFALDLLSRLKKPDDPVAIVSWAKHKLLYIHPYADGVGRTTEVIGTWLSHKLGLPIPNYDGKTRDDYMGALTTSLSAFTQFHREAYANAKAFDPNQPRDGHGRWVAGGLPLVSITERGVHFETGVPVDFLAMHGKRKAENYGSRYQQDIEPAGLYVVLTSDEIVDSYIKQDPELYEKLNISFKNPLVIASNTQPFAGYDENSWKSKLSDSYGKKGLALSKAILADGYDGIVTVRLGPNKEPSFVSEIVDLTVIGQKKYDPNQPRDEHGRWTDGLSVGVEASADSLNALRSVNLFVSYDEVRKHIPAVNEEIKKMGVEGICGRLGVGFEKNYVFPTSCRMAGSNIVVNIAPPDVARVALERTANDSTAIRSVIRDVINEELIHAAWFSGLKERWKDEHSTDTLFEYVQAKDKVARKELINIMAEPTAEDEPWKAPARKALLNTLNYYYPLDIRKSAFPKLLEDDPRSREEARSLLAKKNVKATVVAEFLREIYQADKTGRMTEVSGFAKLAEWVKSVVDIAKKAFGGLLQSSKAKELREQLLGLDKYASKFLPGSKKYNPDQPRVPAGHEGGGRWTSGGSASSTALDVIQNLTAKFPQVAEAYEHDAGVSEGYTIGQHTRMVADVLEKQMPFYDLKQISTRNNIDAEKVMRFAVALHDIGKGKAIDAGKQHEQHEYTWEFIHELEPDLLDMGLTPKEQKLAAYLSCHDYIGQLVRGWETPAATLELIRPFAQEAQMPLDDFLTMNLLHYTADAGSYQYVRDAVFQGLTTDDEMKLAPLNQKRVDDLKKLANPPKEPTVDDAFSSKELRDLVLGLDLDHPPGGYAYYEKNGYRPDIIIVSDKDGRVRARQDGYEHDESRNIKPENYDDRVEIRVFDHLDRIDSDRTEQLLDPKVKELLFVDLKNQVVHMVKKTSAFDQWISENLSDDPDEAKRDWFQYYHNSSRQGDYDVDTDSPDYLKRVADYTGLEYSKVSTKPPVTDELTNDAAYAWFEDGEAHDWALGISKNTDNAISNYSGFGYRSINNQLRGNPATKLTDVRLATEEEAEAIDKAAREGQPRPNPPEGPSHNYAFGFLGMGKGHGWIVQTRTVDEDYAIKVSKEIDQLREAFDKDGFALTKNMVVHRGAYVPGLSAEDIESKIGDVMQEPAFTSTFYGPANGRLDSYATGAKFDGLYDRYIKYDSQINFKDIWDEKGVSMRMHINIPKGTKVLPIEAVRSLPNLKYIKEARSDSDKAVYRSEAEILLRDGSRFRLDSIRKGIKKTIEEANGDKFEIQLYDVYMTLVND
jgi:transposase